MEELYQKRYVGGSYPIHDAWDKVSGAMIYTGDMQIPGMYHVRLLFSDVPRARIKKIHTEAAEALEGVVGVFSWKNTPDKTYNNFVSYAGQEAPADERMFAREVRFVGDRVAAVVAVSPVVAQQAVNLIQVEYETLPPIVSIDAAMESGENLLGTADLKAGDADGRLEEISAASAGTNICETDVYMPRIHHAAMENHVCIAKYIPSGELTVFTPCQGAYGVRHNIASFLEMNYSDVRVVKTVTGGSFGGKQQSILEIFTAWLAREVRGTVKVEYDRFHSIVSTSVATAFQIKVKSAVTADNRLEALRLDAVSDAGAYATNSMALSYSAGKKAFRLYQVEDMAYHCDCVYTNTPSAGGFRGWGGPQVMTAIETHMDFVARKRGVDPLKLRLYNLVEPGDTDPLTGLSLGNAHVRDCVIQGARAFGWEERRERCRSQRYGRYRRGVGMACGAHMNGYFGSVHDFSHVILKMNEDGSFLLNTGVHDQGCGTLTSLAVIVADVLEVPVSRIRALETDTHTSPYDMGTYSSRVTYVSGRCAYEAAVTVRKMILNQASIILKCPLSYLYIEDGSVKVKGRRDSGITYREIATISQTEHQHSIIAVQHYENGSNPGSYGCHFAEVEVDTYTGLVRVTDYLAVHDLGCVINRSMVEGQIQGAVETGIGYALSEEVEVDDKGYPRTRNFDQYTIVNMPDMPVVNTLLLEYGGDDGPFGAKSIGEAALIPSPAAVVNAVNHALGTNLTRLPLTPKRILYGLYGSDTGAFKEALKREQDEADRR